MVREGIKIVHSIKNYKISKSLRIDTRERGSETRKMKERARETKERDERGR
jgi:hypothetical protein